MSTLKPQVSSMDVGDSLQRYRHAARDLRNAESLLAAAQNRMETVRSEFSAAEKQLLFHAQNYRSPTDPE